MPDTFRCAMPLLALQTGLESIGPVLVRAVAEYPAVALDDTPSKLADMLKVMGTGEREAARSLGPRLPWPGSPCLRYSASSELSRPLAYQTSTWVRRLPFSITHPGTRNARHCVYRGVYGGAIAPKESFRGGGWATHRLSRPDGGERRCIRRAPTRTGRTVPLGRSTTPAS